MIVALVLSAAVALTPGPALRTTPAVRPAVAPALLAAASDESDKAIVSKPVAIAIAAIAIGGGAVYGPAIVNNPIMQKAAKKAIGGGLSGALAGVVQVLALMWMRTTMNYQHANGLSTMEAISALYAMGGLARLYQGWQAALLQAPLSRFGDTAANAGVLAVLSGIGWMPEGLKTFFASWAAAGFRILITPVDALKTTLQVQGSAGLTILADRVAKDGIFTLWSGALASSFATFMGHYPWFVTYNYLQAKIPQAKGKFSGMMRNAFIGLCASAVSDVVSNSIRVVKTKKQTAIEDLTYIATVSAIIAEDGVQGLFLRGLGTKLLTNGVSAMLFSILWKYFEQLLTAKKEDPKKGQ